MALNLSDWKQQLIRLLREDWPTAKMLSEEVYAILNQLTDDAGAAAANQLDNSNGDKVADVPAPNSDGTQDINFTADGKPAGKIVLQPGQAPQIQDPNGQPSNSGGGGFPAQIQSGSGSTYQVKIFPNGLNFAGKVVQVTQLQIDPSATIPAGTWTLVTQTSDGSYWMQVPVYL